MLSDRITELAKKFNKYGYDLTMDANTLDFSAKSFITDDKRDFESIYAADAFIDGVEYGVKYRRELVESNIDLY